MLEASEHEEILSTALDDLPKVPELLNYKHTLAYTGSMPLEELVETLRRSHKSVPIFRTHSILVSKRSRHRQLGSSGCRPNRPGSGQDRIAMAGITRKTVCQRP